MSSDSLHVVDHAPRFSWRYNDPYARPLVKSQIEVGTDMDWVVAEMWQPTIMIGPDTAVQYAGEPLLDGQTYYMRIRVATDTLWSNWLVAPFRMNSIPSAPTPLFPTPGSIATTGRPSVVVMNSTDAQNDALHYDFEVYRDSALTMLAAYIAGVNGGPGQTTWKVDSLTSENQYHYWRARASDGHENGPWSPVWTFIVDAFNQPPVAFNLVSPGSGETVPDLTPTFAWDPAVDPDPGSTLTYTVTLGLNPSFTFKSEISGIAATTLDWPDSLTLETNYWWKVKADDGRGGTVTSSVQSFKTGSLGDLTGDGIVDVFDIIKEIDVAFGGGLPPNPPSLADVNGDCVTDVFDVIYLIHYVFEGGAGPMPGCAP
ncbi:MAG: hypothetical protein HZB43_10675 [candidate division Zixibacteria bacterium]|nr:hypothetical protein [candidate division Zixibacteria bacterium]